MESQIDSHKLYLHPERVAAWKNGSRIMPINLEVCLIGACNHRCVFCCCDYLDYAPDSISKDVLLDNLRAINGKYGQNGIRSVLLAGTGEPLLYKDFSNTVREIKSLGIDIALSTNGVLLTPQKSEECLGNLSWIRFSTSAGTEVTYKKIHRGRDGDFQKVLDNINYASELKKKKEYSTRLNVQIVMIPDNQNEIVTLARKVKDAGADCLIVKSCGSGQGMKNSVGANLGKDYFLEADGIYRELKTLDGAGFQTVFRYERIENQFEERRFKECYASPFHAFIGADSVVYPCCHFPGREQFAFGSIREHSLESILLGTEGNRTSVIQMLKEKQLNCCPKACKLDPMNQYLYRLVNPDKHDNFI